MHTASTPAFQRLYRTDAIRAMERVAMERNGLSEDQLMARAGEAAWRVLLQRWPEAHRIGVACGPGNNGGDGYVLAQLARESGRDVHVAALPQTGSRDGAGARAAAAYALSGGVATTFAQHDVLPEADVWVDALFGIGLHRALDGVAADFAAALNRQPGPVLALDVPSGIDADRGDIPGVCVNAKVTLSFIAGKCGLYTEAGRAAAGEVIVDRLGLDDVLFETIEPAALLARPGHLSHWLQPRPRNAHKGDFGHVLCVGGDHGFGGAIALCAQSALRCGAGLVSVATRALHVAALIAARPEAMAHAVEESAEFAPLLQRASVIALGPGLGQGDWGRALHAAVLTSGKPLVIDADALNLLAQHPHALHDAVLTPHPGEAARLLDASTASIQCDRYASAQKLADRYAAAIVLKGAGSVVAAPGEIPVVIDAGNPGMATGGMGDVLTGTIAALRAQGLSAFDAAVCGALLHAAAGDAAAHDGGERGLLPSDLFVHLRRLANPWA
jgi:NAD(P)H-hydrate epimerase